MWFFRILIFFPSITFRLLSAEIFPWAFLAVCYNKTKILSKSIRPFLAGIYTNILPLLILLFCSSFFSWLLSLYQGIESDCFRSLFAYLNPLVIYVFLMNCSAKEIDLFCRLLKKIFLFYLALGIFQFSGLIGFLNPFFSFLIPRGKTTDIITISGRGVSLLTSEPSRAAYEIIIFYITCTYLYEYSRIKQYILDFLLFIFVLIIIRSAMGALLFLVYLFLKYKFKIVILSILMLALIIPSIGENAGRAINILYRIMLDTSPAAVYNLLLQTSGYRLISLIMSYKYAILHPFGGGVGLWMHSSLEALNNMNISPKELDYFAYRGNEFLAIRPTSYMASIALDLGIFGILSVLCLLKPMLSLLKKGNGDAFPVVFYFIFLVFFSGAIGNPIPWVCIALVYRKYMNLSY